MTRYCANCRGELIVHRTANELVMYCPDCGSESKEDCSGPAPQWDRAPVKRVTSLAQHTKAKERAATKIKKNSDRGDYVPRRGSR